MSEAEHSSKAIEPGSNRPRGLTIQISRPWAQDQGPDAERRYADVIAAVLEAEDLRSEDLEARLRTHFERADLTLADQACQRLAEQLRMAEPGFVSVLDAYGQLLFGDPEATPMRHEPKVHGAEDPANPDRPLFA